MIPWFFFRTLLLIILLFVVGACSYNHSKVQSAQAGGAVELSAEQADFERVKNAVITPRCLGCHAAVTGNQGGVNLESYRNVRTLLNRISNRSIDRRDMPPRAPLGDAEANLLRAWIEAGAPETVAGGPQMKPDKSLSQGSMDWKKVSLKIFAKKCQDCHSERDPQGGLDLTSLPKVRLKASAIFDRVFMKQDMPVAPYPVLTTGERKALLHWFDIGMPE